MDKAEKNIDNFADLVQKELNIARQAYPPMNSLHEAYAVLLEEVKEFVILEQPTKILFYI